MSQSSRVLYLESRSQVMLVRVAAVQHGLAALTLASAGFGSLVEQHGHPTFGGLAIVASVLLLFAVIWELREQHHPIHARVGWVDLVAVPCVIAEGFHRQLAHQHYLPLVYYALAAITLVRGLYFASVLRRSRAEVGPEGVLVRLRRLRTLRRPWSTIADVQPIPYGIELVLTDGQREACPLDDIENRTEAEAFLLEAWGRAKAEGLAGTESEETHPQLLESM
jgi:hypothetical protein